MRIVNRFIHAVIENMNKVSLQTANDELETIAAGWTVKSTERPCYHGVVLVVDGLLSSRTQPRKQNCPNPADYYSGHTRVHGLNVQAAVDHMLRFRYVAVAAPGKTNDGWAFMRCDVLTQWIDSLQHKYFVCAETAYPLSNKTITPFRGAQLGHIYHSSFNYQLSQLRIRVELAFGRLTTKFRRLRKKCPVA
jgi:hypothetical protein